MIPFKERAMALGLAKEVVVVAVMCLFLVACGAPPDESTATVISGATDVAESRATVQADPAPDFTLISLDGQEISLGDYQGQWVLLNFWATWCPPCVAEMPYLQTLADRGLNVLGVNMAEEEGKVKLFAAQHGIEFPILMEPYDNLVLDYQARSLPRTVIIAPDGTIALRIAGPINGELLDPWLDENGVL
jgi:peroxiredoxin